MNRRTRRAPLRLDLGTGREPPREFLLFRAGSNDTTKGTVVFDDRAALATLTAWRDYGNDLAIDYGHGMADPAPMDPARSGVAAGWFRPEVRAGALWATAVRWTDEAAAAIRAGKWRYVSPWIELDEEGRCVALINVALTNTPATKHAAPLVPLHRQERTTMDELMKALTARYGARFASDTLKTLQDGDQMYAAFALDGAMVKVGYSAGADGAVTLADGDGEPFDPDGDGDDDGDPEKDDDGDAGGGSYSRGAAPKATREQVLATVAAVTGTTVEGEQVVALLGLREAGQKATALSREVRELRAKVDLQERRATLDALLKDRKISPAEHKEALAGRGFFATLSRAQLSAWAKRPALSTPAEQAARPGTTTLAAQPGAAPVVLTPVDEEVIRQTGVSREAYVARKATLSRNGIPSQAR